MKNYGIEVLTDFQGAMIDKYTVKENNIYLTLKKEKPTIGYKNREFDYNLHFNFGLKNLLNTEQELLIFLDCNNEIKLPHVLPHLWISENSNQEYQLNTNISGKTDFHGKYYFKFLIQSKQTIYIANFPPKEYNKLFEKFKELSTKTNAIEIPIGKTVQNRSIIAYEYGNINDKPTLLFVSGFHPPERDTIALEAIMEKFLDRQWREKLLEHFSFSLIPILNPDGFANSMQGSNSNDINFHWSFFGNTIDKCPEAYYIWEYCKKITPVVFFDFHAFTFQNNHPRPYLIPDGYYIGKTARSLEKYYNLKLSELCGLKRNLHSRNEKILAPTLLATKLRNTFGTLTIPKFHLHMRDGLDESKHLALNCVDIVLTGLNKYNIVKQEQLLKCPYGLLKPTIKDKVRIKMLNFWFFSIIPILNKILHG